MNFSVARVLAYLLLAGVGVYIGTLYARWLDSSAVVSEAVPSATRTQIQMPSPHLSPADVVRLQVDALRALRSDQSAIHQCYELASPSNRAVTGPLHRFTAMVQNEIYGPLVTQNSVLLGRPVIRDGRATVLVTVLDANRAIRIFRFFLSKQTEPQYLDCWMTDAVIPAREKTSPERDRSTSPASAA